jgi:hypothetical protein
MSYQFLHLHPVLLISNNLTAPEWTIYPPDDDQFFLWTQNRKRKKNREKKVRGSVCNEWIIDPQDQVVQTNPNLLTCSPPLPLRVESDPNFSQAHHKQASTLEQHFIF